MSIGNTKRKRVCHKRPNRGTVTSVTIMNNKINAGRECPGWQQCDPGSEALDGCLESPVDAMKHRGGGDSAPGERTHCQASPRRTWSYAPRVGRRPAAKSRFTFGWRAFRQWHGPRESSLIAYGGPGRGEWAASAARLPSCGSARRLPSAQFDALSHTPFRRAKQL